MRTLIFYGVLLWATVGSSQSFRGNLQIENITFPEGNQLAYVYELAQDSTGLMWFYASPSLYTFDGHQLTEVPTKAFGVPRPPMRRLFAFPGHQYFYFVMDSLVRFDPVARKEVGGISYSTKRAALAGLRQTLSEVSLDSQNRLWAVRHTAGDSLVSILRTDAAGEFQRIASLEMSWYYEKTLTRGDRFFVKLRDRVEEFDATGRVRIHPFPAGPDPVTTSMVQDAEGTIWVVHSPDKSKDQFAVYYLKAGQESFTRLPAEGRFPQEEKHGQLFVDGGYVWHRGYPFRLTRLRVSDGRIEDFTDKIIAQSDNFPFYDSPLLNLYRGRSGEIWLTTRAGIVKMTLEEEVFRSYALAQIQADCIGDGCLIKGMTEDEAGRIYLSHVDGIAVLDPESDRLRELPIALPPQPQKIHALTYARGTLFWNEYAIDLRTYATRALLPAQSYDFIAHGLDPARKHLWIAVNDQPFALYDYDLERKALRKLPSLDTVLYQTNAEIRQIHASPTTGTWFLSIWGQGVLEIAPSGRVLNRYDARKSPERWPANSMYGLYEDGQGQLWFGHGGTAGLSKLDLATRVVTEYPYARDAFIGPLKRVFRVLPGTADYLWLLTEKGFIGLHTPGGALTRFPMFATLKQMAFHRLPAHAAANGTLYSGTPDGRLYAFDPERLYAQAGFDQRFPVAIDRYDRYDTAQDSLVTQWQDLDVLREIRLGHQDRFFELAFFVPDYRHTDRILYTYWLEGYDKDWSPPRRANRLRYENLPPGEYTLHIRGGITPVHSASSERSLRIVVLPAWYTTGWAYGLFAGLLALLIYGGYRYQIRRQWEQSEAERIKELEAFKSRLYTNITHEFRTPLTVIMGMAAAIEGHDAEKELIQRNSQNLLRLINQLLDLSKLDAGVLQLAAVQGDIVPYFRYLTESFYSMATDQEIRLTFYPEVRELVMDYDEEKVQHIVYNLLSNAIKFTPAGGKVILHLTEVEQSGRRWLRLKVSDTGVGIAAGELPYIFDRFYQVEGRTATHSGTGIGLALTKELVELMGGRIVVNSEPGRGTDFMILLPILRHERTPRKLVAANGAKSVLRSRGQAVGTGPNGQMATDPPAENAPEEQPTLLIIEDNRDVITYIETLLRRDYRIETARNGREGVDLARELVPDIVISDVMMPELDGYQVCQALKNDELTSHIPIILLTAKATQTDRLTGLRGGADAYLVKPFYPEELRVRLAQLIALRQKLQARYASPQWQAQAVRPVGEEPRSAPSPSLDERFLQKLIAAVESRLEDPDFAVEELCQAVQRSNTQVNRKLKALTGKTPSQFIRSLRLQRAAELLRTTELNISEIAYEVGFNDPSYFSRSFSEEFGCAPRDWRG